MTIGMLTASFHPRTGGVERHVLRVGRALGQAGHAVCVLTLRHPGLEAEDEVEGMPVLRLDKRAGATERAAARDFLAGTAVIHSHDAYPLLKWRRLLPRVPVFMTWHGYEGWPIPLEAKVRRWWAGRFLTGAICMGEFICRWYGHGCDLTNYGAVDPPEQVTDPPAAGPALWLGRLEPDTGVLASIEALGLLARNRGIKVPLAVCGDGSLRARAERLAADLGLEATFHGQVPDPTPHIAGCRLALCSGYLGILECLSRRRPVFATWDNPLKRDYLSLHPCAGRGLAVAATSLEMAGAMADYLEHPERAAPGLAFGEQYARAQTWQSLAGLYLDLYRGKGVVW